MNTQPNFRFTRNGAPAYPIVAASRQAAVAPYSFAVQVPERMDFRPAARHYGQRWATVKRARRAVAERVLLLMRTDGEHVRLLQR